MDDIYIYICDIWGYIVDTMISYDQTSHRHRLLVDTTKSRILPGARRNAAYLEGRK